MAVSPMPQSNLYALVRQSSSQLSGDDQMRRQAGTCRCCGAPGKYQKSCGISHVCLKGIVHNEASLAVYKCQYCGRTKESGASSFGSKGVKIRCVCRGVGPDGKVKTHAKWELMPAGGT